VPRIEIADCSGVAAARSRIWGAWGARRYPGLRAVGLGFEGRTLSPGSSDGTLALWLGEMRCVFTSYARWVRCPGVEVDRDVGLGSATWRASTGVHDGRAGIAGARARGRVRSFVGRRVGHCRSDGSEAPASR